MSRLVSAVFFGLVALWAHADEISPAAAVPEEVSYWPMIIVTLILVGMIGGFAGFIWMKERERKQREANPS